MLQVYKDTSGKVDVSSILHRKVAFQPYEGASPNFGIDPNAHYWIKVNLQSLSKMFLYLRINSPLLDHVEFYHMQDNKVVDFEQTGDQLRFGKRPLNTTDFIFPFTAKSRRSNILLVHVWGKDVLNVPMFIMDDHSFRTHLTNNNVLFGIYFGVILVMTLYNLLLFFSVRDISYLYYILYVLTFGLTQTIIEGYFFKWALSNHPILQQYSLPIMASLSGIFAIEFLKSFLRTRRTAQRLHKASYFFTAVFALNILLALLGLKVVTSYTIQYSVLLGIVFILYTSHTLYWRGYKPAFYFNIAWTILLGGIVLFILKDMALIPSNFFTEHLMQVGSGLEVLLLAFALGNKIELLKAEREAARLKTLNALRENRELIFQQKETLEQKVRERTQKLEDTNDELNHTNERLKLTLEQARKQKEIIERQNNEILKSIRYAKRIQNSILPLEEKINRVLTKNFVLYRTKDIVSGDFYWFMHHEGRSILAVIDCTGHGIPGALLTMIAYATLNKIVFDKAIRDAGAILTHLHKELDQLLTTNEDATPQGMDVSLCVIDRSVMRLQYAGAGRKLYFVRNQELREIPGDKFPIGSYTEPGHLYQSNSILLQKKDTIYLTSDGYPDQFGGERGKKFMVGNFKRMLIEIADLPMDEQYEIVRQRLEDWQGDYDQTDDICVIGLKF